MTGDDADGRDRLRAKATEELLADGYVDEVQDITETWRERTINAEITPERQALHVTVEAGEFADPVLKAETYRADDEGPTRANLVDEAGDVVVAHLGTLSALDLTASECIEAAFDRGPPDPTAAGGSDAGDSAVERAAQLQVETGRLLDLVRRADDPDPTELKAQAGEVFVAHLDALDALGLDARESVETALEKNDARDWDAWQAATEQRRKPSMSVAVGERLARVRSTIAFDALRSRLGSVVENLVAGREEGERSSSRGQESSDTHGVSDDDRESTAEKSDRGVS